MDILKSNKSYNLYCGTKEALRFVASYIFDECKADVSNVKIAIISDRIVSGYYFNAFENQFLERGVKTTLIPVECNDGNKSIKAVTEVYDFLTDFGFCSNDWIVALGGGSIIDVAGFCSSIFNGGINFLAVPTTPSGMYESVVANKSYLNSKKVKNALSVPFTPSCAVIDPDFLKTVPERINHNGYASIIKLAILGDLSIILDLVEKKNDREFLNRVYTLRQRITDVNPRLLCLGEEISSAIESYFRFMNYTEGEALALSLYSCVDEKNRVPLSKIYNALGLPTKLEGVSSKSIVKLIEQNLNMNTDKNITIVDVDDITRRWVLKSVTRDEALDILLRRLSVISPST